MQQYFPSLATELGIQVWQLENTIELFDGEATIPFIARYRKEKTGGLTDEQLIEVNKKYLQLKTLINRKSSILKLMEAAGQLNPDLTAAINQAENLTVLEDLYLPYKPKRQNRASKAIARGLEPLARMIMSENITNLYTTASRFVSAKNEVLSEDEALAGARDIIAEWVNEMPWVRQQIRRLFEREAVFSSQVVAKKAEEDTKYQNWHDWQEAASRIPSHRALAMFRGESENFLKLKIQPDKIKAIDMIGQRLLKTHSEAAGQKKIAISDSVTRLLFHSLENELRAAIKLKADEEAIQVFRNNLKQLLLTPPLGEKNTLAIDPGFRTGCKIVCLDRSGKLLHNDTIYPHPPQREATLAIKKIKSLISAYDIEAIAIGNGTAGRETATLIERARFDKEVVAVMVNEAGASVYSASSLAREEFGQYDITVRGAVSIGRRLMDPLAELVKIDPKALGVGQYQHDVDQKLLKESLTETVELCVNQVGVDLNTASKELLSYVSGIGAKVAGQIIQYRDTNTHFNDRDELKKVPGLGSKTFQQAAGFLRIKNGNNPLDSTGVHPENYNFVEYLAQNLNTSVSQLIGNKELLRGIDPESLISGDIGLFTIRDILAELEKPGRDPRGRIKAFSFAPDIKQIEDLKPGMIVPGIVTNITAFGAFVDIGIKSSGLLHKSEMAEVYVANPADYVSLNQQLQVKIKEVDIEKKRISLTLIDVS
ncbi:MAG: RNA-binding transcriptional accessory protein [Bacteroidales bacterium]|nr:RNA-binding transcriptional accessory protein [Bacteroidales bacterium]